MLGIMWLDYARPITLNDQLAGPELFHPVPIAPGPDDSERSIVQSER